MEVNDFMKKLFHWIGSKKIELGILPSLILIFLASVATAFFLFHVSPKPEQDFYETLQLYPSLFFLNYIPILLAMLLVYFLFNHAILSICLCSSFFSVLGIINQIKIIMRQDPFLPTDFSHVKEMTAILDKFDADFVQTVLGILGTVIVVILLAILFFRNKKINLVVRISAIFTLLFIAIIGNHFFYTKESSYNQYPVEGNIYFQVNHYLSKGFLYSFLHNCNTLSVKKPEGYNAATYEKLENEPLTPVYPEKKPHIIMIMGEAFSDLSINENIDFSNYIDPMENFKKLTQEEDTISGHIVVPNFGGGTSDTEFDVLTACPTRFINNSMASYSFVREKFDAIPRELKKMGYDTLAIHPGYSWFYNRLNVYNYFGFDKFITLDDFDKSTQSKGGYISEEATIDSILNTFDEHVKTSDNPLFTFSVTIQNHGPYKDKYNETQKNFDSPISLTEEETNMLSNYFNGVKDVDEQLQKMIDFFEVSEEPVVLVYFGDHLPGFTNGMDFFDILNYNIDINGTVEQRLGVYETPFLIWQNESAKKITSIKQNLEQAQLPDKLILSSNYLGALVLELLGMEHISALYDFSNAFRKELPIITNENFMDISSDFSEEATPQQQEKIDLLKGWVYYKLFNQRIE